MLRENLAESITEFLFIDQGPRQDKPLPAALEVFAEWLFSPGGGVCGPAAHGGLRESILLGPTGEEGLHFSWLQEF